MNIKEQLNQKRLFFDGAMGTILQEKGLLGGEHPELWNLTHEDVIQEIHTSYVKSGATIIKTNTFGANLLKFNKELASQIITRGVHLAKKAIDEKAAGKNAFVALDIGPTGKLLSPLGDLSFEEAYDIFAEMILCGTKAGADLILIETLTDIYEAKAAILAAKENSTLPIIVTFSFDQNGKLLTGGDIKTATCVAEGLGVDAVGFNCGMGPDAMSAFVGEMLTYASIPVVVNPNAGLPVVIDGKTVFDLSPDAFATAMKSIASKGVAIIGGCCGSTPDHIAQMVNACKDEDYVPPTPKNITMISSSSQSLIIGNKPLIIGERINPTGKPKLKQALYENDMNYLCKEGFLQLEHGAHILDVNVGLPDIDEPEIMEKAIKSLQKVIRAPLQIDTANIDALERGLRIYNGKPLINSVNGKDESIHTVLPLAKKYGATVVALTLDENGIPETAEGRIAIAKKIIHAAKEYGIGKKDILVDALTLTLSTDTQNANITLRTLDCLKNTLQVNTVLGVSNISFGLPQRELINASFYTMALQKGLSTAIINPLSEPMMQAHLSYLALSGMDFSCQTYINAFSKTVPTAPLKIANTMALFDAIVKGLKKQATEISEQLLKTTTPISIIDEYIIPALNEVGTSFEKNITFLPSLLMSAEAAKSSFDTIKKQMILQGITSPKKGKIILATVKGDVHDIGKNIVKVLLENYNYDVIDLGRDVDPNLIVQTAIQEQIPLVGLSALMTTTVTSMEKTITLLREEYPQCKVMVGGAVLTQSYADKIGADFYSSDAMGSVHYANKIFDAIRSRTSLCTP